MKKTLLSLAFITISAFSFGQFTTGTSTSNGLSVKIDTSPTTVTLTITAPSTVWFGIGFGGSTMALATDMFIWSSSSSRDYTSTGQWAPSPDTSQDWTMLSDIVVSGFRTIVASRPLASTGDYTFVNDSSPINVIIAGGSSLNLVSHFGKGPATLPRTALGVEDFSLKAASVYPNPSTGIFNVQTKTGLDKINVYSQIGAFVKTIEVENGSLNAEINLKGLQSGVYMLELQNSTEKSWKKIILE